MAGTHQSLLLALKFPFLHLGVDSVLVLNNEKGWGSI